MANETNTGLPVADLQAEALMAMASRPFDPATLLTAPVAPALPYAVGPEAQVVRTFDPATLLGDAARRGPAMIGDGKPLVARIGGVEVVTIPIEHYAALLSPLALARDKCGHGSEVDDKGLMDILMSLHAGNVISSDKGLDDVALGERVAAWAETQPQPWAIESVRDGAIVGTTDQGQRFTVTIAPRAPVSPVDFIPTPDEASIDLAPERVEVPLTAGEVVATYDAAVQRGDTPGGVMDRAGQPAEPLGKGEAAYLEAGRGKKRR